MWARQEGSLWEQYLNVLYPSPEDLQRIANMDLLDVLVEKGDVLTAAREVQHWTYFRSEQFRALFRDAAVAAGFRFVSESSSKGELPFGIVVARTQSIEQNSIDRTVIELLNLSRRFDGDYDGWETPIVTQ
jgi:regulator of RNase E activity RraB